MKAISDTGFLFALLDSDDPHHGWAVDLARRVDAPVLTCEAVLAETSFHLRDAHVVLQLVQSGFVRPVLAANDHVERLTELAHRYADRQPDLADLCLIRLSELYPKHPVLTTDVAAFHAYRRGRREAIPLIVPPQRVR